MGLIYGLQPDYFPTHNQLRPDFGLAYRNLGNLYASQQQFQGAERCFSQALRSQKED